MTMSSVLHTSTRRIARLLPVQYSSKSRAFISTVPKSVAGFLDWKPTDTVTDVKVDGFIRSVRAQKKHHFVSLGDGSSIDSLQAVVPADQAEGWGHDISNWTIVMYPVANAA